MSPKNSSNSSVGGGNTKTPPKVKQISPAKNWCFTFNNYKSEDIEQIEKICSDSSIKYIFQEETGENGTPHLQGYVEFPTKKRPLSVFKSFKSIHWEKRIKSRAQAISYCHKEDTRTGKVYTNLKLPKPIKVITKLKKWQSKLEKILMEEPDDRSIYWYWETIGNIGKSAFAKYICYKYNALEICGKASDMKCGIVGHHKAHGVYPEIIILDIPRTNLDYLSYAGIEEIKNGLFFSPKYESGMVIMNSPHIVCFANEPPDIETMSKDRWKITRIKKKDNKMTN